jgi:phage tail sheath gpL-like
MSLFTVELPAFQTPSKAYEITTGSTSVSQQLSHDCRRISIHPTGHDIFYGIGNATQVAEGAPAEAVALVTAAASGVAEVRTVTLSGFYEVGDQLTVVVAGTSVTYEVTAADQSNTTATTLNNVAASLRDAINANSTISANLTATASGAVVTITHGTVNTAFTLTAEVTANDDDNHFVKTDERVYINVPVGSYIAVKTTTSNSGKCYISEYV